MCWRALLLMPLEDCMSWTNALGFQVIAGMCGREGVGGGCLGISTRDFCLD